MSLSCVLCFTFLFDDPRAAPEATPPYQADLACFEKNTSHAGKKNPPPECQNRRAEPDPKQGRQFIFVQAAKTTPKQHRTKLHIAQDAIKSPPLAVRHTNTPLSTRSPFPNLPCHTYLPFFPYLQILTITLATPKTDLSASAPPYGRRPPLPATTVPTVVHNCPHNCPPRNPSCPPAPPPLSPPLPHVPPDRPHAK